VVIRIIRMIRVNRVIRAFRVIPVIFMPSSVLCSLHPINPSMAKTSKILQIPHHVVMT
jgi:hypothetical protein